VEHRDPVRRVIWENPVHHNPRYDARKAGMPREMYQELEDMLKALLASRGASLVFIDAWRETQSYEEWERTMLDSDVAVECKALGASYVDYQAQKPAVKVLNYMSLGLPVICDSLPAYRDLGEDGKELLFADSLDAWRTRMTRLLDDAALRARLGEAARAASEPFRIENVARRYVEFFERITGSA
jgi:glycosyltransferase involved in cell wall biosynthesis